MLLGGNMINKSFKKILFYTYLIFLIFVEVPINIKAFALFFEGQDWILLTLAIAVGAMIVLWSYSIGHLITNQRSGSNFISFVSFVSLFSIIYLLAIMRQKLSDISNISDFQNILEQDIFNDRFFIPLGTEGIILIILNLCVVSSIVVVSYLFTKKA